MGVYRRGSCGSCEIGASCGHGRNCSRGLGTHDGNTNHAGVAHGAGDLGAQFCQREQVKKAKGQENRNLENVHFDHGNMLLEGRLLALMEGFVRCWLVGK
jgi:hypothetical protein